MAAAVPTLLGAAPRRPGPRDPARPSEQEDDMTVTTPLGQVLRDEQGVRLEFVRTYDDPLEDVWAALTNPDRVARWLGTVAGDPDTGTVELTMNEDESRTPATVTILECEPPTQLVLDVPSPAGGRRRPGRARGP